MAAGAAMRQLVRRPVSISVSPLLPTSSPMRQPASSLLLRRLQSTKSSTSTPTFSYKTLYQQRPSPRPRFNTSSSNNNKNNNNNRSYSSQIPPKKGASTPVKFWPFFLVVALSSGAYIALVNKRVDTTMAPPPAQPFGYIPPPPKPVPTFSPQRVTVLFVLGGPGAGKGTQCANLVRDYGFVHLSAGDLLRAEQDRPGSQFGELIKDCIRNGDIVPMEVTVQLLENAMTEAINNLPDKDKDKGKPAKFLIDGFPRKMDQAVKFEETVCPAKFVLFYDCPEEEMQRRLLERGKTSGRADDNAESIKKRFRTFEETSMPVVEYFEKKGKVVRIDATGSPAQVYEETRKRLGERLGDGL